MSSERKPTPSVLDVPLGEERRRIVDLLGDRWVLWLLLAVHERDGARFTDLAAEPGLSRRTLSERLVLLVDEQLLEARRYSMRPPRSRYFLTVRGAAVRAQLLPLVHVAAGGALDTGAALSPVDSQQSSAAAHPNAQQAEHPADRLLAADPAQAAAIYHETIAPLVRYDEQYSTSLVQTLSTYLACDASVSVTASRLYAHRHTIRYRLDRVTELTGFDVSVAADRERLALGVRAMALLAARGELD